MAINTSISANFITYLENVETNAYYGGPYLYVDFANNSVIVNGETIKNPVFTIVLSYDTIVEISTSWLASSGNTSSANILFYIQAEDNITGTGTYVVGSDVLPDDNNFTALFAVASSDLSAWNGNYNTYVPSGSDYKPEDEVLVVNSPSITYKSKAINNYVYLIQTSKQEDGTVTQTCQVSWFASGGNDQNAIIGFSISGEYFTFFGEKWTGDVQPVDYNFMGTTQPNPPSNWMVDTLLALEGAEKSAEDTAEDAIQAAEDAAKDVADGSKDVVDESKDAADAALKATEDAAKDATDDAKDAADATIKATEDAAKDAADEAEKAAKDAADAAKDAADQAKNASDAAAKSAADEAKDAADAAKHAIDSIF